MSNLSEPEPERRGLLMSLIALLAARYFDKETIKRLFLLEEKMIRTNTFIDDWIDEAAEKGYQEGIEAGVERGIERGIEQGVEQGEQKERRQLLLQFLEHQFTAVPIRLVEQIYPLSAERLYELFNQVLMAKTLEEVEEALHNLQQAQPE